MIEADAIIIGGGPAGSTCAWKLQQAGMDVVVVDKSDFPRDKVCAGWITPAVIEELQIDLVGRPGHDGTELAKQDFTGD